MNIEEKTIAAVSNLIASGEKIDEANTGCILSRIDIIFHDNASIMKDNKIYFNRNQIDKFTFKDLNGFLSKFIQSISKDKIEAAINTQSNSLSNYNRAVRIGKEYAAVKKEDFINVNDDLVDAHINMFAKEISALPINYQAIVCKLIPTRLLARYIEHKAMKPIANNLMRTIFGV